MSKRRLESHRFSKQGRPSNKLKSGLSFETLELRRLLSADLSPMHFSDVSVQGSPGSASDVSSTSTEYSVSTLSIEQLAPHLARAPFDPSSSGSPRDWVGDQGTQLTLPTPEGGESVFAVQRIQIVDDALAAKLPDVQTYRGVGVSNPGEILTFTVSPNGVEASVLQADGVYHVRPGLVPEDQASSQIATGYRYVSYYPASDPNEGLHDHDDFDESAIIGGDSLDPGLLRIAQSNAPTGSPQDFGTQLRTFRLAVAATGEFVARHGGTRASAQATIIQEINKVNAIFEPQLSIRLELIDNTSIIFLDAVNDPYSNNNNNAILAQNQAVLDNRIGSANYDVGHVFSTGGGGLAFVGVVGDPTFKGRGVSGENLNGSPLTVAHELGHMFGSHHTWNGVSGDCTEQNWIQSFSVEPGSGSTIMSYSGTCGSDNLRGPHSPYFHSRSIDAIISRVRTQFSGIGQTIQTGNLPPIVSAGPDYTIPAGTPFELLEGSATDDSGTQLTYRWEQRDTDVARQALLSPDDGTGPLFRSYPSDTDQTRVFPPLESIVNGLSVRGERLPEVDRELNFRLVASDGLGGVGFDSVKLQVVETAGSFEITNFNTNLVVAAGSEQTILWDVAGTDGGSINAASVDIFLSDDGGQTFDIPLLVQTANDGEATVTLPDAYIPDARIKLKAHDNIFFNVNDLGFVIGTPPGIVSSIIQDFESTSLNEIPEGWSFTGDPGWEVLSGSSYAGQNGIVISSTGEFSDRSLQTPVFNLPETVEGISFWHQYFLARGTEGGVLEISIDGTAFTDFLDAGGQFLNGGYDRTLSNNGNPLGGRNAWSGISEASQYIRTVAEFPANAHGKDIQLRWRTGTDDFPGGGEWRIDNVSLYGDEPTFETLVVNSSNPTRSEVTSLRLAISNASDLTGENFELFNESTGEYVKSLIWDPASSTLTFGVDVLTVGDPSVSSPTLVNGVYSLNYLAVPKRLVGSAPVGDLNSRSIDSFFRRYGDTDGDNTVGLIDFAAFRSGFGSVRSDGDDFPSDLDADRDGVIGLTDFASFRAGFGNT